MNKNDWEKEYIEKALEDSCFMCDGCNNSNELACDNSVISKDNKGN